MADGEPNVGDDYDNWPWQQIKLALLGDTTAGTAGTTVADPTSLYDSARTFTQTAEVLDTTRDRLTAWRHEVLGDDEDQWSGAAAGEFGFMLKRLLSEVAGFLDPLIGAPSYAEVLMHAGDSLAVAVDEVRGIDARGAKDTVDRWRTTPPSPVPQTPPWQTSGDTTVVDVTAYPDIDADMTQRMRAAIKKLATAYRDDIAVLRPPADHVPVPGHALVQLSDAQTSSGHASPVVVPVPPVTPRTGHVVRGHSVSHHVHSGHTRDLHGGHVRRAGHDGQVRAGVHDVSAGGRSEVPQAHSPATTLVCSCCPDPMVTGSKATRKKDRREHQTSGGFLLAVPDQHPARGHDRKRDGKEDRKHDGKRERNTSEHVDDRDSRRHHVDSELVDHDSQHHGKQDERHAAPVAERTANRGNGFLLQPDQGHEQTAPAETPVTSEPQPFGEDSGLRQATAAGEPPRSDAVVTDRPRSQAAVSTPQIKPVTVRAVEVEMTTGLAQPTSQLVSQSVLDAPGHVFTAGTTLSTASGDSGLTSRMARSMGMWNSTVGQSMGTTGPLAHPTAHTHTQGDLLQPGPMPAVGRSGPGAFDGSTHRYLAEHAFTEAAPAVPGFVDPAEKDDSRRRPRRDRSVHVVRPTEDEQRWGVQDSALPTAYDGNA